MSLVERTSKLRILVPMRLGETPVPIPNTTVRAKAAENTMLETAWEDRWVPDPNPKNLSMIRGFEISSLRMTDKTVEKSGNRFCIVP